MPLKILCPLFILSFSLPLQAATIEIYPTNSFIVAAENLKPGDTLIVHQGTYAESDRLSIQVRGTAASPVVIMGANGESRPLITRATGSPDQNTINIEGATYITIKNLEISNNSGNHGIVFANNPSYVTLDGLVIHDIDVGIYISGNSNNLTVKNTQIYNTGRGNSTGEGMYIGCNNASCRVTNSTFENNWIHDALPGTSQGDGIEVKVGSHSNIIRNNVIYNRPYPGILVYGNAGQTGVNTVEGNVLWNCSEAIVAIADAIVRNNIIFDSPNGIGSYSHTQVSTMKDLTIANNTLYNNDIGLYLRWGTVSNMVLANNAVYSPGKNATDTGSVGLNGAGITVRSNYITGNSDVTIDNLKFFSGGSETVAFANPSNKDFWPRPGSVLIGNANASYTPVIDFNGHQRISPFDVGAYETDGSSSNPGWKIAPGFKGAIADTIAPNAPTGLQIIK